MTALLPILLATSPLTAGALQTPLAARSSPHPAARAPHPGLPEPQPEPIPSDPLQTTVHRLANGLTIYLSPNHQLPRISAYVTVRAGSKDDPAENTGLAHYLEHMMFKGTPRLGTLDYESEKPHLGRIQALYDQHYNTRDPAERKRLYAEIDKENIAAARYAVPNELDQLYRIMGFAGVNAFTSNERTVYIAEFPSNRAEAWARVEAERLSRPVFRLFQSELEAVYEEKNESLDNAEVLLHEAVNRRLYKAHPYGQQTLIGTIEHLKNPSLSAMYDYFKHHYVPGNVAIALAGDFERKDMLELLTRHFAPWKAAPPPRRPSWPLPKPSGREAVEVRYEAEEKVTVSWLTVPHAHPDRPALMIMDMLVDNAVTGIINLTLNQRQRVKAAGSYPQFFNDAGEWTVWALPKAGQTVEQAEALLMEAVGKLKAGEFTDADISAVITDFEVSEKTRLENNEARVRAMSDSFTHFQDWRDSTAELARLRLVTKEDVLRVARKYVGDDRVVGVRRHGKPQLPQIEKPGFTKIDIDSKRRSPFAAAILELPALPPQPKWLLEGRDFALLDTPAGRVYAARNPVNDLFSLEFVFARGRRHEPKLCEALALLELAGAGDLSPEDYKRALYALGSSVHYGCGERESSVAISGLDANLWPTLELMRRRFEDPRVAADTLKDMVAVAIGARADNKKNPDAISNALGHYARRGADSPLLRELSDAQLRALKTDELLALARGVFDTKRRIGYVGNRRLGELAKLLEEPRRYKDPPPRGSIAFSRPADSRVLFIHRDMVQAQVGLTVPDGPLDPARWVDYSFLSNYLGGDMSSLIFQEVRESRALAYYANGGYRPGERAGDDNELWGAFASQADKADAAAALMAGLLRRPTLSAERFAQTAKAIEQAYRTNPLRFRAVPGALMDWEDQGLPPRDPRPERFERALRYRLEDLAAFAGRFAERPLTLYLLGHRDRIDLAALKKLGQLEEKSIDSVFP